MTFLAANTTAQKNKKSSEKKAIGIFNIKEAESSPVKREPSLILEPCAKETPEQIAELESAADKTGQLQILTKRINDKDDWLRACAIYRLGEFRGEAQESLPVIIKLLHDEENDAVWTHVETALWKISPDKNISLNKRIELSKNPDVYLRLYGVYSLAYFRQVPNTFQAKDTLQAMIEAAQDEDIMVRWMAVMGIRQFGFYGINTSDAISVLSDLLENEKMNPVTVMRAFVPMGAKSLPAAPLLFDVLYNPKKYAQKNNEDNNRSYMLDLTTAIALGRIGKPLLPLLEKEVDKKPFEILQVLNNFYGDGTLPIFIRVMKSQNPEVRKKAIENLPGLTSIGAVMMLPSLLTSVNDKNTDVAESAISKVGSIAKYTQDKSDELKEMLRKKAIPLLISNLNDKVLGCRAVMNIGRFGADGEIAIPAILRSMKKDKGNYCTESALFELGEAGRKYLSAEKLKEFEEQKERNKDFYDRNYNKAKPINPKTEENKTPVSDGSN